jgi:hypothetical protein
MAIQVSGTEVISNARALTNIASVDATTAASIGAAGVGGAWEEILNTTISTSTVAEIVVSLPAGYVFHKVMLGGIKGVSPYATTAVRYRMGNSSGVTITSNDYIETSFSSGVTAFTNNDNHMRFSANNNVFAINANAPTTDANCNTALILDVANARVSNAQTTWEYKWRSNTPQDPTNNVYTGASFSWSVGAMLTSQENTTFVLQSIDPATYNLTGMSGKSYLRVYGIKA